MAQSTWLGSSHRRRNALTGEWVLNSPERLLRPWGGQTEPTHPQQSSPYEKDCYLCPGNQRANGQVNPCYTDVFVFANDFPALHWRDTQVPEGSEDFLFQASSVVGFVPSGLLFAQA